MRMKRFLCLFLILPLLLSGCARDFFWLLYTDRRSYDTVAFDEMVYTRPDPAQLQEALDAAKNCSTAAGFHGLMDKIDGFYLQYDGFFTNYALANLHYSTDLTDTEWQAEYNFCAEAEPAYHAALEELYEALAASPFRKELESDDYFGADFFDAYESDSVYDSTFLGLLEEEAGLINRYYALTNEALALESYSREYYDQYAMPMTELLAQLVAVRQKIATYAGFSDYVEYAYTYNYARDYSPEQVEAYARQVSTTLRELYTQTLSSPIWQETLSYCSEEDTFRYVSDAANAMGGVVQKAFQALSDCDLYDIAYSENKYPTSFTIYLYDYYSPFVFLCPYMDQGDKLTFAHEFGHFASDYLCYGSYAGTDIAEIHSQACEYLTLCYSKDPQLLTRLKMADSLCAYVECTAYTLFEHQMYRLTGSELTAENILGLYRQIGEEFGFESPYWDPRELVTVTHFFTDPLYNISYVVSNDLALQLYQLEQGEKGAGLRLFEECLTDESSYLLDFALRYKLQSPFAAGRLEAVADTFRKVLFP